MAHVNRRIGKSSETAITTTDGTGGGVLDSFMHDYFQRSGNVYNAPGALVIEGIQATGGVINDYTEGTDVYRSHIFTSSGTFTVNSFGTGSSMTNNVHYVVIGGGGGGAYSHGGAAGGGGGAGGVAGNDPYIPSTYRKGALRHQSQLELHTPLQLVEVVWVDTTKVILLLILVKARNKWKY